MDGSPERRRLRAHERLSAIGTLTKCLTAVRCGGGMHSQASAAPPVGTAPYDVQNETLVGDPRIRHALSLLLAAPNSSADGRLPRVSDLPHSIAMSRSQFYRLFRTFVGMPPGRLRKRLILHTAAELLLLHGHLSVKQVAASVGLSDISHFSRSFANEFGMTPTAFRRLGVLRATIIHVQDRPSPDEASYRTAAHSRSSI